MAQEIENASNKASTQMAISSALAKAGDIKQAVEVAQKIENADYKAYAQNNIAMTLATEPIPGNNKGPVPVVRRIKKEFTPKEKELAKQFVEACRTSSGSSSAPR